jgi:hypothetical protein
MKSDNLDMGAVPEWVYRVDSPPEVDEEPWTAPIERAQSRDVLLLCIAGMVIIAILAFWAGTRA